MTPEMHSNMPSLGAFPTLVFCFALLCFASASLFLCNSYFYQWPIESSSHGVLGGTSFSLPVVCNQGMGCLSHIALGRLKKSSRTLSYIGSKFEE